MMHLPTILEEILYHICTTGTPFLFQEMGLDEDM